MKIMTKEEIEEIKSLLKGLAGISNFKSTGDRVDKMIVVLDNELSKLHQPTVSVAVCDCLPSEANFIYDDIPCNWCTNCGRKKQTER
jgi:hypothetical protein